jgi:hypothetical protein
MQYVATSSTLSGMVRRWSTRVIPIGVGGEKHVDGVACCRVEVLVACVALYRHLRGDMGIVLGYLAKVDCLRRLALCSNQLLLDD